MLVNNDNCGTPAQNLVYDSTSCFYGQGRDIKNITNIGLAGIGVYDGKFNDMGGLRTLNYADASMDVSLDAIAKVIKFKVNISATAAEGNVPLTYALVASWGADDQPIFDYVAQELQLTLV